MKKLGSLLIGLMVFACHKTEDIVPKTDELNAMKNGKVWINLDNSFRFFSGISNDYDHEMCNSAEKVDFTLTIYNADKDRRESVSFSKIPKQIGSYTLINTTDGCKEQSIKVSYYTLGEDGDVIFGVYTLLTIADNKLIIDKYEESTKIMNGKFSATFIKTSGQQSSPDTIKFSNGVFKLKLNI